MERTQQISIGIPWFMLGMSCKPILGNIQSLSRHSVGSQPHLLITMFIRSFTIAITCYPILSDDEWWGKSEADQASILSRRAFTTQYRPRLFFKSTRTQWTIDDVLKLPEIWQLRFCTGSASSPVVPKLRHGSGYRHCLWIPLRLSALLAALYNVVLPRSPPCGKSNLLVDCVEQPA